MRFIYSTALITYSLLVRFASIYNKKAKQWIDGRKDLFIRISETICSDDKIAWFHCASLGEFEQGRPVIEEFKKRHADYKILITFFSPSGYAVRKDYPGADYVFYMPIDTRKNAKRFVELVNPRVAIFIKYEFWINFLEALHKNSTKIYVVSAIFRPSQLFFKRYGKRYRKVLSLFNHIFVQNKTSVELLKSIGIDNCSVCGDTRFDRVYQIAKNATKIDFIDNFAKGHKVFITGSSWEKDDQITLELINKYRNIKFIIAPHEISSDKINNLCHAVQEMGRTVACFTKIDETVNTQDIDVILIDTIGILSSVYQYGYCAYIGGGFGVGIHNTLEAATFGLPIIFGPNYKRFDEAVKLVEIEAAQPISCYDHADEWLSQILANEMMYENRSKACIDLVAQNVGATASVLDHGLI